MKQTVVSVGPIKLSNVRPIVFIGGPCVLESEEIAFQVARSIKTVASKLRIPYIFKGSYDKANRSSIHSYRGPGIKEGLRILSKIRTQLKIPVLTDVHSVEDVAEVARVVDVVQIPAFLCRQTDLIVAAARSGRVVNIKKGQFLSPNDMVNVVKKLEESGHRSFSLTERGNSFGYNNLVVDMRGIEVMKSFGYPVVFDATHSVQSPGGQGAQSGGDRAMALPLAKAAVAMGVAGVFMEVHPNPDKARSDGANSIRLKDVTTILRTLRKLDNVAKSL